MRKLGYLTMSLMRNHRADFWKNFLFLTVFLSSGACVSSQGPEFTSGTQFAGKPWTRLQDCFERNIVILPATATEVANTCGGPTAAGDAGRTGTERANASFHAVEALVQMSEQAAAANNPTGAADDLSEAIRQITASYFHEGDQSIVAGQQNSRFKLRRNWYQARLTFAAANLDSDSNRFLWIAPGLPDPRRQPI